MSETRKENMKITNKRFKEDERIRKEMDELRAKGLRDTEEYKALHRRFYIDNDDIRRHWKTY
jgi:hypothetical protein